MATQTQTDVSAQAEPPIVLQTLSPPDGGHDGRLSDNTQRDAEAEIAETVYPTGTKFYLTAASCGLVMVLAGIDLNVVATAIPAITDHFHTSADIGWYSAAFRLTTCSFQFLFGKLYKIFPVKLVFLASLVIFLLGSVLCASATSSKMFVLGRAVCGLGTAGEVSGALNIMTLLLPPPKRPMWNSILAMVETSGAILGPILGGVLTERLSWRWCFWISLPTGGVALLSIVSFLEIPEQSETRNSTWKEAIGELDLLGNVVFVPSVACLFVVLGWAGIKYPWSDPKVIGLLVASVGLMAIFAYDQYKKQDRAILPPRILKQRTVIAAVMFSLCCNSTLDVIVYYMPTYYQIVRDYSPSKSGYLMLPLLVGMIAGTFAFGSGTTILGYYTPFMIAASVMMPVATGLMTTWDLSSTLVQVISYSTFVGFATCIGIQAPLAAVQNILPPADVALGVAVVIFCNNFGPALAMSIAQAIFTERLVENLKSIIPGLDANLIETTGLSQITANIKGDDLQKVILGVDKAVIQTWYFAIGLTCVSMIGSLAMEWRSIKQKKT
ncbi:putative efflux pump antibiotic resistance protein [Myriangium duriaei CBS 260.36]|uniref:Efflux pump antibiotic resistance protein n=1 Tax=Myriangium duriaei CBS 260.36 TaxID=1168546 RepID=A0A9P4ISB3_9PEZI|nr:putative efflux pump antibiotic resistance protein [Myriangium duriaei CBS 260.36]